MNSKSTILANSALLCAALLTLAGCPSATESRFYLLTTLKESAPGKAVVKPLPGPALHVRVKLAKYLHRPEIVTRVGPNQYRLAEYDRWAEPLQENLSDILAENLSGLLPGRHVLLADWPGQSDEGYRLDVEITRLDGPPGGKMTLEARWQLVRGKGRVIASKRRSRFEETAEGAGFDALVAAQSRALGSLSRELAAAVDRAMR